MHRSWIVWLTSTVAFSITVAIIIVTGPAQRSNSQSVSPQEDAVRLPQISAYAQNYSDSSADNLLSLSAAGSQASSSQAPGVRSAASTLADEAASQAAAEAGTAPSNTGDSTAAQPVVGLSYQPKEVVQLAHPSNYGNRYTHDANGKPVNNDYIVVLHETVGSASSALNTFQTNHPRDEDQVSYHTLIGLDGTIYYVVPPEQRAYGAGNSVFQSFSGEEAVFTNAEFPSSVNNFAYHISLETPIDGQNNGATYHSGYTEAQYQSLAWLLARTNIPDDRITTHRLVDRSASRIDPRSFEADKMFRLLRQYPGRQQSG